MTSGNYAKEMTKGNHRRKVVFVAIAIILSLTTGLYTFVTYNDKAYISLFYPNPGFGIRHDATTVVNITRNLKIQKDRLVQVRQTCERYRNLMTSPGYAKHRAVFNAAPHYNWSYCKIGKIGSTLWTQFFYILHHEGETVKDVLVKCREDIHNMEGLKHTILGVNNSQCNSTRMILSARNPYTRLFSAFIDRMYISSTSISVRGENDPKCKPDITFQEFLQHVVNNTRRGIFDYHWSPVFYLCKPCEINPAMVFKQETFKDDFYFAINQTKLEPYKLDVLIQLLHKEANLTGFSLADDVLDYITPTNQRHTLDCQTWEQVTRRLWDALKIQGFISEKAPFPSGSYKYPKIIRIQIYFVLH